MPLLRRRLLFFFSSFILLCTIAAQGQEKKAIDSRIDAATVAAYQSLGAEYGGWVKNGIPPN